MADNTETREFGLTPKFGLIKIISERTYSDRAQPVIEYIRNAWDARATEVDVKVLKDSITISDNGDGMDLDGLEKFLDVGESPRVLEKRKSSDRKCMGQYGIGNLAAFALGEGYKVTTVKDGQKIVYDLNFKELEASSKQGKQFYEIKKEPKVTQVPKTENGTKIEIYGLHPKYSKRLDDFLDHLRTAIGKKMPVRRKDFKVYLNGKDVPHYIDQYLEGGKKHDIRFSVTDDDGQKYNVEGWFRVAKKALKAEDAGFFPVINEEITIKDGNMYKPDLINGFSELKNCIYGEFVADFLSNRLTASRDSFNDEQDTLVTQIYEAIREQLKGIALQYKEERKKRIDEQEQNVLDKVTDLISYGFSKACIRIPGFDETRPIVDPNQQGRTLGAPITEPRKVPTRGPKAVRPDPHPGVPLIKPGTANNNLVVGKKIGVGGYDLDMILFSAGAEALPAEINEQGQQVLLNRDHLMYQKSKEQGEAALTAYLLSIAARKISDFKLLSDGKMDPNESEALSSRILTIISRLL